MGTGLIQKYVAKYSNGFLALSKIVLKNPAVDFEKKNKVPKTY